VRKLDSATIRRWRTKLTRWADPAAFDEFVEAIRRAPGFDEVVFTQAGLDFFRDAWLAAKIAQRLSADRVRLCPADRPDFELDFAGEIRSYEATEADMPDRRRGDEPIDRDAQEDPVEDWRKRFDAIGPSVGAVVAKKLQKTYDPEVRLLIYVNLGCYGAYLTEGAQVLRAATEPAKHRFKEVFAYWEGNLYLFWQNGGPAFRLWKADADDF
jgi:hypothetical protein